MYDESENSSRSDITVEGIEAKVTFKGDIVELTPSRLGILNGVEALDHKIDKYDLFNSLTSNVDGLNQPKILSRDPINHRYTMERAKGFNLDCLDQQGGALFDFVMIPTEIKYKGMLTYLKVISELNKKGYSFIDHKRDSIFLNPQTGDISIVDVGVLKTCDNFSDKKIPDLWREEVSSDIVPVLKSFFTRDVHLPGNIEYLLVPAFVNIPLRSDYSATGPHTAELIIDSMSKFETAPVPDYMKLNHFSSIDSLVAKINERTRYYERIIPYARKIQEKIHNFDYKDATSRQIDIMDTELNLVKMLSEEEIQYTEEAYEKQRQRRVEWQR